MIVINRIGAEATYQWKAVERRTRRFLLLCPAVAQSRQICQIHSADSMARTKATAKKQKREQRSKDEEEDMSQESSAEETDKPTPKKSAKVCSCVGNALCFSRLLRFVGN